jgi:hypothetical protein
MTTTSAMRLAANLLAAAGLLGFTACAPPPSDTPEAAHRSLKCEEYDDDCEPPTPLPRAAACFTDLQNIHISATQRSNGSVLAKATIWCTEEVADVKIDVNLSLNGSPVGGVPQPTVYPGAVGGMPVQGVNTAPCVTGSYAATADFSVRFLFPTIGIVTQWHKETGPTLIGCP